MRAHKCGRYLPLLLILSLLIVKVFCSPDLETLRPNAPGTYTQWPIQYPNSGAHWDKVDEEPPDEDATYIRTNPNSQTAYVDTYNIPDSSIPEASTIHNVTIYIRVRSESNSYRGRARTAIYTYSTLYYGSLFSPTGTYVTYSRTYDNNPNTANPWTITEINALEIGVYGYSGVQFIFPWLQYYHPIRCTQVYTTIEYTPPGIPEGLTIQQYFVGFMVLIGIVCILFLLPKTK